MPPKAVPLAYSGRKLTTGPEGYNPKKERQVKNWIHAIPAPQDATPSEAGESITSLAEVCGGGGQLMEGCARVSH